MVRGPEPTHRLHLGPGREAQPQRCKPVASLAKKTTPQPQLLTCWHGNNLSSLVGTLDAHSQVNRAEGLLLRVHRKMKDGDETEVAALLGEVSSLLSAKFEIRTNLRRVSATLDLCQVTQSTHRGGVHKCIPGGTFPKFVVV